MDGTIAERIQQTHESHGSETRQNDCREEMWLLGQPSLQKYLDYVQETVVGGENINPATLANEWRTANDYYGVLEQREAGIADQVELRDVDPALTPLIDEVMAQPRYQQTFDTLPTHIGMAELDRLILCQIHVTRNFVDRLSARLGPLPDPETLFRFCMPLGQPSAPVTVRKVGSKRFVFRSDSTDFRFHEPVLLRPDQVCNYNTFGEVAGVVGLVAGFSSNLLNVIRYGKRLLLHNGYHRACALRALGITHAPCIITTITRRDELDIIAKENVCKDPDFYFGQRRPPVLKDFFDPKICKLLPIHKLVRMIEVSFEVRDYLVSE
jgi:hypothetical protein